MTSVGDLKKILNFVQTAGLCVCELQDHQVRLVIFSSCFVGSESKAQETIGFHWEALHPAGTPIFICDFPSSSNSVQAEDWPRRYL